jgi:hypothetical protein
MDGKTGNPTFGIDQKPPRPKTLREFFDFVCKTCPSLNHDESDFFDFLIESFKKPHIEFQYRPRRLEIEKERFKFKLDNNRPLNEYWDAAEKYLRALGVSAEEINKFSTIMSRGFK